MIAHVCKRWMELWRLRCVESGALKGKAWALIHNSFGHTPFSSYYNFMYTVLQAINDGCADTKQLASSLATSRVRPLIMSHSGEPRTFYLAKLDSNWSLTQLRCRPVGKGGSRAFAQTPLLVSKSPPTYIFLMPYGWTLNVEGQESKDPIVHDWLNA